LGFLLNKLSKMKKGKFLKVAFRTLGCKLNFSETSTIANQFKMREYEIVDFSEKADIYVINTCTVTDNADKECRQIIRKAKKRNPNSFMLVTGCFAQLQSEKLLKMAEVDAVLGTAEKFKIFELLEDDFSNRETSCVFVTPTDKISNFYFSSSTEADERTRAFFKIQDGCDYLCTFCTIPKARGKSRSMEISLSQENFRKILADGYKEIILTGVNVGDYGKSTNQKFSDLLNLLLSENGEFKLRISSIEPNLLTDEIIQLAKHNPKLVNHFHIPLQSGTNKILQLMKRRYNTEFFKNLINKLNSEIENVGIGIDIITGFPGETDEDFQSTYKFLSEMEISYLHVFTYSERENTEAVLMENSVPEIKRKERTNMLRNLSEKKKLAFMQKNIGKKVQVLFEHQEINGKMRGYSSNYIRIETDFNVDLVNKFVEIEITNCNNNFCYGKII